MKIWEGKKYKLVKSQNFDAFLKLMMVNFLMRTVINSVSPTMYMLKTGSDEYEIHTTSAIKTTVLKFQPGVEFDEPMQNGNIARSVVTFEGDNKVVQIQKQDKTVTIIREFGESNLTMTLQCENVEAKRFFEVIE